MKVLIGIIIAAVIALAVWLSLTLGNTPGTTLGIPVATATYSCDADKSITASYYEASSTLGQNGGPPMPGGSVKLVLSDGRTMTLKQTISADGTRYSDGDPQVAGSEKFVFWSKGSGATVVENNDNQTYVGCIAVPADPGGLSQVYSNGASGFAIRYPANYTPDASYQYQELGPGKDIPGTKFTIDPALAQGTNLATDSYLSVEQMASSTSCTADRFIDLGNGGKVQTLMDNGVSYSFASSTGAGAGNRYEEWVYAVPGTNPCTAVRYYIHYGVLDNYPAGTVTAFDHASLLAQFDAMRRTLTVVQ